MFLGVIRGSERRNEVGKDRKCRGESGPRSVAAVVSFVLDPDVDLD